MADNPKSGIKIGERVYEFPSDFTIGEAEEIERICNLTPAGVIEQFHIDASKPGLLRALAWVAMHREDVTVLPDDIAITNQYIGKILETGGNGGPPKKASARKGSSSPAAATSSESPE